MAELMPDAFVEIEEKKMPIAEVVVRVFGQWLDEHPAPDEKRFFAGAEHFSARDIVAEIQDGSDVGVRILEMVMKVLLRRSQGSGSGG